MTGARRIPPGRAGRLRLRRSLAVAERGAELLDRKLRILREEHDRLLRVEEAAARAWEERLSTAETWLLRGVVLGGEQALEAAAAGVGQARFTMESTSTMGIRHPTGASCTVPDRPAGAPMPGNAALVHAEPAYAQAVLAAGEYAAARAAARVVGLEAQRTGQRVRALRRHWIPRLEEELAQSELALEQTEHEDAVRRRWAADMLAEGETPEH